MTSVPAKKSLGQNWLVNEGVVDRIVQSANLTGSETVVEVGPGKGALTARLAERAGRVIAIEKDARLIESLREQFAGSANVQIEEGDILELNPQSLGLSEGEYSVIANLPYYITSHFIRALLTQWPRATQGILMVQREVAQRISKHPPNMNLLSLSVRLYAASEKVMDVSRGSFRPSPDVDSAVIRLVPKKLNADERALNERALTLARAAFGQRRKQLTATIDAGILSACDIAPTLRPQELPESAWLCLTSQGPK